MADPTTTPDASTASDSVPGGSPSAGPDTVVHEYKGTGVFWTLVALFVPLVLLIVMLAQNAERVSFEFLWWNLEPPLYVVLLVAAAASAALTEASAAVWRHRRRKVRTQRSELDALRSERLTS